MNKIDRPRHPRIELTETGPETSARILNRHPTLQSAHLGLFERLFNHGLLPARDREILILRTAWNCRSVYEFGKHAEIAGNSGVNDEEILALTWPPAAHPWSSRDRALIAAADDLWSSHCASQDTWDALGDIYDEALLLEALYVVGFWSGWANVLNATGAMTDLYREHWPEAAGKAPATSR